MHTVPRMDAGDREAWEGRGKKEESKKGRGREMEREIKGQREMCKHENAKVSESRVYLLLHAE